MAFYEQGSLGQVDMGGDSWLRGRLLLLTTTFGRLIVPTADKEGENISSCIWGTKDIPVKHQKKGAYKDVASFITNFNVIFDVANRRSI